MLDIDAIMHAGPVIPVLTVHRVADAVPIARALVAGGVRVLEVTLRTPVALDVIREMQAVEGAIVGAGTVLDARQLDVAMEAGCAFAVAPGLTTELARAATAAGARLLPGAINASEIMRARDFGFTHLKLFPAIPSGGLPLVHSFAAVFPDVVFCPTGGITAANAADWLAEPNVACVGGSWLVSEHEPDPVAIEAAARATAALCEAVAR